MVHTAQTNIQFDLIRLKTVVDDNNYPPLDALSPNRNDNLNGLGVVYLKGFAIFVLEIPLFSSP